MNYLLLAFSLLAAQVTYGATQAPSSSPAEGDVKSAAVSAPVTTAVARAGTQPSAEGDVKVIEQLQARAQQIRETLCPTAETLQTNLQQLVANYAKAAEPRMQALEIAGVLHPIEYWHSQQYAAFANSLYKRSQGDPTFDNGSAEAHLLRDQEKKRLYQTVLTWMKCLATLPSAAQQLIIKIYVAYFLENGDMMYDRLTSLFLCDHLNTTGLVKELLPVIADYASHRHFSARDFVGIVKASSRFQLQHIDNLDGLPEIAQSQNIDTLELHYNAISQITAAHLSNMPKLTQLTLFGNRITHFPGAILVQCKNLRLLDISDNPIEKLDDDFYQALKTSTVQFLTVPKTLDKATQERLRKEWADAGKEPYELTLA